MWKSTARDWPAESLPVAVWERDRLFVALRVGDLWYECTPYGDVCMSNGGGAILADPEKWCHLPARLVKLKPKTER